MKFFRILLILPLLAAMPAMAQQASVVRDTDLKNEPFADAKTITSLKAKTRVDVGERRGGWYQVKSSDGKTGWLRLTAVLLTSTQGTGDSGIGATRQLLQTGRSGSTGVTAATGIRGLDSADVVNSKPDPEAVARLEALKANSDETRRFAAAEHLSAHRIGYQTPEAK